MAKQQFRFSSRRAAQSKATDGHEVAEPPSAEAFSAIGDDSAAENVLRMDRQHPPMHPRDELVFLLQVAAEIEHSLMVQYLFAAYSLPPTSPHSSWKDTLLGIAREEMGHLMAVQNILLALSGPLTLNRDDVPYNEFSPFEFKLEALTVRSLARYVLAEMPEEDEIPDSLQFDIDEVRADAGLSGPDDVVKRVGALFRLMVELADELGTDDIDPLSATYQADPEEWYASIYDLTLTNISTVADVVMLLDKIGVQGEGPNEPQSGNPSHFRRFFDLYRQAKEYTASHGAASLSNAVPDNPTIRNPESDSYLQHPDAFAWGDVFNHRFRWLFVSLAHHLRLSSTDTATRDLLRNWTFEEMYHLRNIAAVLQDVPQHEPLQIDSHGRPRLAAGPFELPYTLELPTIPSALWRYHNLLLDHGMTLLDRIPDSYPLRDDIRDVDVSRQSLIQQMLES